MQKILITLSLIVLSAASFAAEIKPITFDSIILTKDSKNDYGIVYVPSRNIESWCAGQGNPLSIMSFEAAQTMENLTDGLYRCAGKFVQIPSDRMFPVQIFQLDSCTEVNPADLRASSCKKTK